MTRNVKTWLPLCALLLGLAAPAAATAQDSPSYQALVDNFFTTLSEEDGAPRAVDDLYGTSPYAEQLGESLLQVKEGLANLPTVMGEFLGHERITVKELTPRFAHVWEIAYFDRQPMSFYFTFYRPKDRWQVYSMDFTGDLPAAVKRLAQEEMVGAARPGG